MALKSLVIRGATHPNGTGDSWQTFNDLVTFIKNIETPTINADSTDIGKIVSGIPTSFARADLFNSALCASTGPDNGMANLNEVYKSIVNEWRGFIACLALDYQKVSVKRVNLEYHDKKSAKDTANVYEPAGAFGNMLLERRALWCDQKQSADTINDVPFIDIIKYDEKVIGGTSPQTFFFTSSSYKVDRPTDRVWVHNKTGKFIDPLNADIDTSQLQTLYAYVKYLKDNIGKALAHYSELPKNLSPEGTYNNISHNLERWMDEMQEVARKNGCDLNRGSVPQVSVQFDEPFKQLFCYTDKLFGLEGTIFDNDGNPDAIPFEPQKLLLPETSDIARLQLGADAVTNPDVVKNMPIYVLKASIKGAHGQYAYFALPLSALGLNVFGKNIGGLVGFGNDANGNVRSSLTATFDMEARERNLEVTLKLVMANGRESDMRVAYTVSSDGIMDKDILLWPNFISKQWDRYFLYSEMPHNVASPGYPYRAMPFVGDMDDVFFRILLDRESQPVFLAENGKVNADHERVNAKLLITADNRVADNAYKYEIYESDKPFKGVRLLSSANKEGGFLIINYSSDGRESNLPQNNLTTTRELLPVNLGFDFGSTNTSIAYFSKNEEIAHGFTFKNMRVSLFGKDKYSTEYATNENQILFFPEREIESNAVKSILALHDSRRLYKEENENLETSMLEKEVKGGFPCFINNLPISAVTSNEIQINFPHSGNMKLIHNMKWSENDTDKAYRKCFLRALLLQTYANLFLMNKYPASLTWGYPSSMPISLIEKYKNIWGELTQVLPLHNKTYRIAINDEVTEFDNSVNPFANNGTSSNNGNFAKYADNNPFAMFGDQTPAEQPENNEFAQFGSQSTSQKTTVNGRVILLPDDPKRIVEFAPKRLFSSTRNAKLTEACAVANYMYREAGIDGADRLTLCFDIGGSTTDISALVKIGVTNTMIKQNSIRFAAQRVSQATKYSPNLQKVLTSVCERFNLHILGLNVMPAYTPDKAPYYFEQIVDRLTTDQLPYLYQLISTDCRELMNVNIYVTGLIIYYAGQIAGKLIDELNRSTETQQQKYRLKILFAGKGSRLFEWFSTTNNHAALDYYMRQFVAGIGGPQRAGSFLKELPTINISSSANPNVKYEVSKGLAVDRSELHVPSKSEAIEILGEENFALRDENRKQVRLEYTNSITAAMFEQIGSEFGLYTDYQGMAPCVKFAEFMSLFYNTATTNFDFKMPKGLIAQAFKEMNIESVIRNSPEFRDAIDRAREGKEFDFVAPIIILEGMSFYDSYLLKEISRQ